MKIVLVTGGFDPIHSGHIDYLNQAAKLGDKLWVGINSDKWLTKKKGMPFQHYDERFAIVSSLKMVDRIIPFDDEDGTACNAIEFILNTTSSEVIFANGGDRNNITTPEYRHYRKHPQVTFAFGVGGDIKRNSSSLILKNWSQPTTERNWGKYTILDRGEGWQVKQLEFDTGKALSDQRHSKRSEHWHIVDGVVRVDLEHEDQTRSFCYAEAGCSVDIPANTWHKVTNIGNNTATVIEVWLGNELTEDDIERRD